jgi:superfamily I DNA/RNA helicase
MTIALTDEQLKVIEHPVNEHGRLLAGPGTGKMNRPGIAGDSIS